MWEAFFKQTGAVKVDSLEELMDVTMTFIYLPPPKGWRVAFMGAGGGISVSSADACTGEGLEMPPISILTKERLAGFIPPDGTSIGNPLDIGVALTDASLLARALEPVAADPAIDAIIYDFWVGQLRLQVGEARENMIEYMVNFAKSNIYGKPLMTVVHPARKGKQSRAEQAALRARLLEGGIPAYHSLVRASRAYSKFISYYEYQRQPR